LYALNGPALKGRSAPKETPLRGLKKWGQFVFANFVVMSMAGVRDALWIFSRHMMIMARLETGCQGGGGVTTGRNFVLRQKWGRKRVAESRILPLRHPLQPRIL
jgi:hypothetical protein